MSWASPPSTQLELLCIGDLITLDDDGGGSIATHGLADTTVGVEDSHVGWTQTAFMIRPQQNYAAENALNAELEKRGLSREVAAANADQTLRMLFDTCANEVRINLSEFEQKCGVEIRYGMIVQLEHALSEKYLHVSQQRTTSRDFKVLVDRNAGGV